MALSVYRPSLRNPYRKTLSRTILSRHRSGETSGSYTYIQQQTVRPCHLLVRLALGRGCLRDVFALVRAESEGKVAGRRGPT
jgi:hypothetical protein